MRRLLLAFIVALLLTAVTMAPVLAQEARGQDREIGVVLDGIEVDFDVAPLIQNGRTLVPFRAVAEALNVGVSWDNDRRQVIAEDDSISVVLKVGSSYAQVNKDEVEMDTAPIIIQGRTLVPLRFFAEAFGCEVDWNQETRRVEMNSPPKIMKVTGFYALGDEQSSSWTDLFAKNYPETGRGNTDIISDLALGWFSLDEKGNLLKKSTTGWQRPEGWERVLKAAGQYKMDTEMLIHITDGGGQLSRFLSDAQAVERAVEKIIKEARLYNGVNLDFEGLGWEEDGEELQRTRLAFNNFVEKLSQELKKESLGFTLTLHAPNSAYPAYDYAYLGKVADYIIIMAYDYGTKPEPVQMVRQAVEMARESVPGEKLLLGISAASETPESLAVKIGIARRYKLEGIAMWRLGLLSDKMWDVLRARVIKSAELLSVRRDGTYDLYHQPLPQILLSPPGQLYGGERLRLLKQQDDWSQVQKAYLKGWIPSWYLQADDELKVKDIKPEFKVVKKDASLYLNPGTRIEERLPQGRLLEIIQEYGEWRYAQLIVFSVPNIQKAWVRADILAQVDEVTPVEGFLREGTEIFYEDEEGYIKTKIEWPMAVVFLTGEKRDGLVEIGSPDVGRAWTARENIEFTRQ